MTKDLTVCCLNYISHYFDITHVTGSTFLTAELSVHEELYTNDSMSISLVTFALLPVTSAAVVGISHSVALSVALLVELMERTIWQQQRRAKTFTGP